MQLVYVCSPGNPTGRVMTLDEWRQLFELSDRHGFVIAADECYSEIYFDEVAAAAGSAAGRACARQRPVRAPGHLRQPVEAFECARPAQRLVAGDAEVIRQFLLYRTYHGNAMSPPVQSASIAAWKDEAHVVENRRLYAQKFAQAHPVIARHLPCELPDAAFYLWARTPIDDAEFARRLFAATNVTVLPGSYLSRDVAGHNPGAGYVRIALVAEPAEVAEAARRIATFQL